MGLRNIIANVLITGFLYGCQPTPEEPKNIIHYDSLFVSQDTAQTILQHQVFRPDSSRIYSDEVVSLIVTDKKKICDGVTVYGMPDETFIRNSQSPIGLGQERYDIAFFRHGYESFKLEWEDCQGGTAQALLELPNR